MVVVALVLVAGIMFVCGRVVGLHCSSTQRSVVVVVGVESLTHPPSSGL